MLQIHFFCCRNSLCEVLEKADVWPEAFLTVLNRFHLPPDFMFLQTCGTGRTGWGCALCLPMGTARASLALLQRGPGQVWLGFLGGGRAGGSPFLGCAWKGCPGSAAAALRRCGETVLCQRRLLSGI